MMDYKVSVFTCVYNRTHTIHRVFESMKRQTYKNIEHIIVDDGSTDNLDPLVEKYISEVDFPVKYIKKSNGGKHTATNIAWDNSEGDFIFQLDSDDEILPEAIGTLVDLYKAIPDEEKDEYWCVLGRCVDQNNKKMIGEPYPDGINALEAEKAKSIANSISGDKVGLMKREKLIDLRYPEPAHVTFVTESHLWYDLNIKYRTWYSNNVVLVYYINEGGSLSNPVKTFQAYSNYAYNFKYELENRKRFGICGKRLLQMILLYAVYYELSTDNYKNTYSALVHKDYAVNLIVSLLKIPAKLMRNYIIKRWNVK